MFTMTETATRESQILEQYVERVVEAREGVEVSADPTLVNEVIPALILRYQSLHAEIAQLSDITQHKPAPVRKPEATPGIIFAIERTLAAWAKMSVWVFTIGMLGMNSNQAIAAAALGVRLQTPVFIIGLLLAFVGVLSIPYHLRTYEKRMQFFANSDEYGNRQGIHATTFLLFLVMSLALLGSAIYGAMEVVQVN